MKKIDNSYYQDPEYSQLYRYILDIEKPPDLTFYQYLRMSKDRERPLRESERDLDNYLEDKVLNQTLTPWYQRWKKWFLDKTRFKEHELID